MLCLLGALWVGNALAESWSGKVVDIRSGQPLANVRLYGGARGRVDLTPPMTTGGDGQFVVAYDAPLNLEFWLFYLLTSDYLTPGVYFQSLRVNYSHAGAVAVRKVPVNGYIRGVVKDKATGQALPNVPGHLGVPGAYWQTVQTDTRGPYEFLTPAYEGSGNYEEGIPTVEQHPHEIWQQAVPKTNYWLEVAAPGYRTFRTSDLPLQINLLSSTSPELHTFATLEVVANSDAVNSASASATIKNPYVDAPTLAIAHAVKVSFATRTGVNYQLQRSGSAQGQWENEGEAFTADGTMAERYFDAEPAQVRFYRAEIVVVP